jgi:hypothetical protein
VRVLLRHVRDQLAQVLVVGEIVAHEFP